ADVDEAVGPLRDDPSVGEPARAVAESAARIRALAPGAGEEAAREIALSVARTVACAELCKQGAWATRRGSGRTAAIAARLAARGLGPGVVVDEAGLELAGWGAEEAPAQPSDVST
ncbi:MAG TPA: hypothetical protein VEV43_05960, partial [Actinomycetota bacterium]|nr:hypothetical protein [Actinomycetota bacterium]